MQLGTILLHKYYINNILVFPFFFIGNKLLFNFENRYLFHQISLGFVLQYELKIIIIFITKLLLNFIQLIIKLVLYSV